LDRATLEALIRAHQAELYRYARYLGADGFTAEDVVQDTFLAAAEGPPPRADLANARRASAWLRGVARNVFLMHCRSKRTSPVKVDSDYLEKAESIWASRFLREGDGFDYVEALRRCLETLPRKQRRVIDLQYVHRKARAEMATLFNMTDDGIKSLLRRVRAILADCIERRLSRAVTGPGS
jgi:RNA polymerase sigma-70 factor (ECF subfamily)